MLHHPDIRQTVDRGVMPNLNKNNLPIGTFIKRMGVIPVLENKGVDTRKKLIFASELISLGYEPKDVEKFDISVLDNHQLIINTLKKMKAGHVDYVPLFQGFPENTPSDDDYLSKRIIGFLGNYFEIFADGTELDNGLVIPDWLFDLEEFGADPITQFQDKNLYEKGKRKQNKRKEDEHASLTEIRFVDLDEANKLAKNYLQNIFYANSSVKEALKEDIEALLDYYGGNFLNGEKISFKETKSYLMKFFWDRKRYDVVKNLSSTPTDLLRLFASLTDSDISLEQKIRFPKLNKTQRKMVMSTLEKFDYLTLCDTLPRYRGLWIAVANYLHVGEFKNRFPVTATVFNSLRNENIPTWNSEIECSLQDRNVNDAVDHLTKRPGEFARRLHHVLRIAEQKRVEKTVLVQFSKVAQQVTLKNLLILERYFKTINNQEKRTVINKKGKICIFDNNLPKLKKNTLEGVSKIISNSIVEKIKHDHGNAWENKKVWINPELKNYVLPLAQRKASDSFLTAGRGTRLKFDDSKVLRLFVYWKQNTQRTDLDLSLIKFDENMNYDGHVSYTHLRDEGIVHSGDIQSAPSGAAEFIDVDITTLKKKGVKYIAPQVYKFCGNSFAEMNECYAGWMIRDKINSNYKSFDIKTVENAFSLNGTGGFCIPMFVDLETNDIVYTDLFVGNKVLHNRVEGSHNNISTILTEVSKMVETKPNIFDVANFHCIGRGAELVTTENEADIRIGIKNSDINASEIETVLKEFAS